MSSNQKSSSEILACLRKYAGQSSDNEDLTQYSISNMPRELRGGLNTLEALYQLGGAENEIPLTRIQQQTGRGRKEELDHLKSLAQDGYIQGSNSKGYMLTREGSELARHQAEQLS